MNLNKKSVIVNDTEIVYWTDKINSDEWIVLLHGAGMDGYMFSKQVEILQGKYNLLVWDARGHGQSQDIKNDFTFDQLRLDLLKILEIENCFNAVFIGQSMGGNLAQEITFHNPEIVTKLVLIGCTRNTSRLTNTERFLLKITPFLLRIYPWNTLVKQSAVACSRKKEIRNYVTDCLFRVGKPNFIKIMTATMVCLHEEFGYIINKPILLLCGEYDKTGNIKKVAYEWEKIEPDCKLHIIENAAHNANQDNPEVVNKLITEFLGIQ